VVILNEAFAKKYWPKGDPLGQSILIGKGLGPEFDEPPRVIVGIVGDVHEQGLDRDAPPVFYVPETQAPDGVVALGNRILPGSWIVRTPGDPARLTAVVQREMLRVDPELPVSKIYSMAQIASQSTGRQNFDMLLLGIFAGVALLLAAVGIYGVMSWTVEQRTGEIGIRMALGAPRALMLGQVLAQGLALAGIGVAVGLAAAYGLTRYLSSLLYGVKPADLASFIIVPIALTAIALVACFIPARRASRVDPVIALRYE
jgi:predicted lysophospholipase L1 biosynthesis ABC-type transport system permease subunit